MMLDEGRSKGTRGFLRVRAWATFEWSGLLVSSPPTARCGWIEVIMRL